MTQKDIATLHALRLDGQTDVATLLDLLVARVEELEREVRRQRTLIGGLVEHEQIREERERRPPTAVSRLFPKLARAAR